MLTQQLRQQPVSTGLTGEATGRRLRRTADFAAISLPARAGTAAAFARAHILDDIAAGRNANRRDYDFVALRCPARLFHFDRLTFRFAAALTGFTAA